MAIRTTSILPSPVQQSFSKRLLSIPVPKIVMTTKQIVNRLASKHYPLPLWLLRVNS
jgi:hypothetical protein